jgi:hypothetical protein
MKYINIYLGENLLYSRGEVFGRDTQAYWTSPSSYSKQISNKYNLFLYSCIWGEYMKRFSFIVISPLLIYGRRETVGWGLSDGFWYHLFPLVHPPHQFFYSFQHPKQIRKDLYTLYTTTTYGEKDD